MDIQEKLHILNNTTKLDIKNIICFYVDLEKPSSIDEIKKKKQEDWTYQDYLTDCCDKKEINLIWLNKYAISFTYNEHIISIDSDYDNVHISLNHNNTHDTVIFQGQANDHNKNNYDGLMYCLEYEGYLMFNTIDEINIASNKYLAYNILLQDSKIPQPKTVLITKDIMDGLTDDLHNTSEQFWQLLDSVYNINDNINNINNNSSNKQYVVKILNGSLGIGVFICDRSEIQSILQTMFTINNDSEFIIQEFKKNTGDIRVHCFSVDGKNWEILASMKRNKIDGDFRSNVSLGATTETYELSDEQKEIVQRVAKLSGLRWVGIDLMSCEDGDYVIEYNSSPGVQGISQQIKHNIFDIIIDKINDYIKKYAVYNKNKLVEDNKRSNIYVKYDYKTINELFSNEWSKLGQKRQDILYNCLLMTPGSHYKLLGKDSPDTTGLDCSGYVKYIMNKALNIKVPKMCAEWFRILSDSCWEQIPESELKPGDIGVKNESSILNHCGIYAGKVNDKKCWFESTLNYGATLSDCSCFKYFFRIKDILYYNKGVSKLEEYIKKEYRL